MNYLTLYTAWTARQARKSTYILNPKKTNRQSQISKRVWIFIFLDLNALLFSSQEKKNNNNEKKKMSGWSELPPDIINSISLQIDNPFSLIHFRSVCSSWRSFSILKFRPVTPLKCPLPLDSGGCGDDCHILNSRVYLLKSPNSIPRPKYWWEE